MKKLLLFSLLLITGLGAFAQNTDSLMNALMAENNTAKNEPVIATFKSSRIILSHSSEVLKKYNLDFRVTHRFGDIAGNAGGVNTFYGIDNAADIRIAFEYGISDRLTVGFGRNKIDQTLDLHLKYRILQQTTNNKVPLTLTFLYGTGFIPYHVTTDIYDVYAHRFSYVYQAIIARKFSDGFSLEVLPTLVHRNYVPVAKDENDIYALGTAGRLKLTKRFGIVADYYYIHSAYRKANSSIYKNPLGLGVEIETGGHVFSLNFTNSTGIIENNFIPNTTSSWLRGEFRFGFNISRMFTLYHSIKTHSEMK
jgi:hypothetical protein